MKIRWKDFELPSGVECDQDTLTDTYGNFWIEPFERGFGSTMGNSLRRIFYLLFKVVLSQVLLLKASVVNSKISTVLLKIQVSWS